MQHISSQAAEFWSFGLKYASEIEDVTTIKTSYTHLAEVTSFEVFLFFTQLWRPALFLNLLCYVGEFSAVTTLVEASHRHKVFSISQQDVHLQYCRVHLNSAFHLSLFHYLFIRTPEVSL